MHKMMILPLLMLVFAAAMAGGEKEKPLPKGLPPYGPLKPFVAPQVTVEKLSNGLTLWLVARPGFPKVAITLAVRGGYSADPKDLPGVSDLILATIDQGTKTRDAKRIAQDLQAAGGDLSGASGSDSLVLSTQVLAGKLGAGLDVLADVVQNATFPDDEVALAKRNQADALRAQEADPGFLARRAVAKAMFGSHPYSVISATQESIAKTTAATLRSEYARRFRPDQALLVVVGDFDAVQFRAGADKLFGKWANPTGPAAEAAVAPSAPNPHAVFVVARPDSVQTTLEIEGFGPTRQEADYAAAEVANALYGGMFGSRLINNIREDKGYTYSPGSGLQARRAIGVLSTRADVRNAVTGASLNEISYELNRMATTAPGDDELARAQRFLVGLQAIRLQSAASVAGQLANLWIQGLPPETLGEEAARIPKVTVADVEAVGRKYFPFSRQTIVVVGVEKEIQEQFAPFGLDVKPAL